jgi:predicted RNase H-like HicB family nuclease
MTIDTFRQAVKSPIVCGGHARLAGMKDALNLTIVYESGDDGWIAVSIPEVPGVFSQGRTRKEAREMVLSALNDWLRFYVEDQAGDKLDEVPADADTEPVRLSFAA